MSEEEGCQPLSEVGRKLVEVTKQLRFATPSQPGFEQNKASFPSLMRLWRSHPEVHLSRPKLAEMLGIDQNTIYRWENGLSLPRGVQCNKLIDLVWSYGKKAGLDVDLNRLLGKYDLVDMNIDDLGRALLALEDVLKRVQEVFELRSRLMHLANPSFSAEELMECLKAAARGDF